MTTRIAAFVLAGWLGFFLCASFVQASRIDPIPLDVQKEMKRLCDKSPKSKVKALRRLAAMGERAAPAAPLIVELLDSNQTYETLGDKILNTAMILGTSGSHVMYEARCALVKIGRPSVNPLIIALKHPRPKLRSYAALTLGDIHDLQAVEPLVEALTIDSNHEVRMCAAQALGAMADYWSGAALEKAVPALITALGDDSIDVCQKASYTLGKMKNETSVPDLIRALRLRGNNSDAGLALFMITGQRLGNDPEKWQQWWDIQQSKVKNRNQQYMDKKGRM